MAAAVVQISYYGESASTPAGTSGETTGFKFNLSDTRSSAASPIQIPTGSTGTAFSWPKYFALDVTTTGTTNITDRMIARSSAPPAGLIIYFATSSAYVQPTTLSTNLTSADNADPDGATTNWTALTTTYQNYSTYSQGTSSGKNGDYFKLALGVSSTTTYVDGPGSSVALPDVLVQYSEA